MEYADERGEKFASDGVVLCRESARTSSKKSKYTRWPFSSLTRKSPFSKPLEIVAMLITGNALFTCELVNGPS